MPKILLAEDDSELNFIISTYLKNSNFEVVSCQNGSIALKEFINNNFDLVLSDIMMPEMNGFELAQEIRSINNQIPIVFLTAKEDKQSKQLGYKIGIDDYLIKPFDLDELIMKVRAILRRATINNSRKLTIGNLTMDCDEHTAYVNNIELNLTVREFDILFKLLSNPKKTFTRSALMETLWDYDSSATSRTVDVYMAKLREKTTICNGFEIVTVHGLGYKAVPYEV